MKILVRSKGSKEWKFAESVRTKAESELQRLLVESPSLIMIDEIREGVSPLIFALSEFGLPGSGATDIPAFSSEGDVAIIECKLAANPESKRKVIGQILEYAAYLWHMGYEEIDSRIKKSNGKSLSELVEESVAAGWDEELFRNGVKKSLDSGSFVLVIVVDEINEELRRIIRYVNECSQSAFSLHALEMNRFQADKTEVLVPHVYGISAKPPAGERKEKWTEEKFFDDLGKRNSPNTVKIAQVVYKWSLDTADRIWFGTGAKIGSFTFHYLKEGKTISVFTIYSDGKLMINYGWLSRKLPSETLEKFHGMIHKIPSLRQIPSDFSKWPTVRVEALKNLENLEEFKKAVVWLRKRLES